MFLDQILIHTSDRNFLRNFARLANRPHALMINTDKAGMDARLLPNLIKYFLCLNKQGEDFCGECASCKAFNLQAHPDFLDIKVEEKKLFISIAQIKDLIAKLGYAPSISNLRVCLINDAHLLNEASANALLKSLEEPEGEHLYILTTNNLQAVLPTILSRTIVWNLSPMPTAQLLSVLPRDLDELQKQTVIRLAAMNVDTLEKLAGPEGLEMRSRAYEFLYAWLNSELLYESMQSKWNNIGNRDNLSEFIFYLTHFLRDLLLIKNNCTTMVHNIDMQADLQILAPLADSEQLFELLTLLKETEAMQVVNISGKLLLDNLFIQLMNT